MEREQSLHISNINENMTDEKNNRRKNDKNVEIMLYAEYIDFLLEKKNFENVNFFEILKDGIILENLVKKIKYGDKVELSLEESSNNNQGQKRHYQTLQRIHGVLKEAKDIGLFVVNIEPWDIMKGDKMLIFGLTWQLVRRGMVAEVIKFGEKSRDSVIKCSEKILLNWVNDAVNTFKALHMSNFSDYCHKHDGLKETGLDFNKIMLQEKFDNLLNFKSLNTEIFSSEIYLILYLIYFSKVYSTEEIFNNLQLLNSREKALSVFTLAEKICAEKYITADDIIKKNKNTNFLFFAMLFTKYNSNRDLYTNIDIIAIKDNQSVVSSEKINIEKDNEKCDIVELSDIKEENEHEVNAQTSDKIEENRIMIDEINNEFEQVEEYSNEEIKDDNSEINSNEESDYAELNSVDEAEDGSNDNLDLPKDDEETSKQFFSFEIDDEGENENIAGNVVDKKVTFDDNSMIEQYPIDDSSVEIENIEEKDATTEESKISDDVDNVFCEIEISDDACSKNKDDDEECEKMVSSLNIQSIELSHTFRSLIQEYMNDDEKKEFSAMNKEDKEFLLLKQVIKKAEEKLNIKFQNLETVPFNEAIMVIEKLIDHASFIHNENSIQYEKEDVPVVEVPQEKKKKSWFRCC
ncbi:Calponin domain protein [Spraguea lophii 42_110]|uniref:Calponin domain protein n=1 Tax=Spraguea lophii (strain 42_110) TaxID=1358809 RepID=S7W757_SPRLO|nr:Calponin domain protein [Spraguea lophii 42_110]